MVPDIAGKGHSFAGALRYYLHDKRQPGQAQHPSTSERVAWTETRNLAVEDPRLAMRLMIATASQAEALKRQAGVKATGRRSTKAVYAFSLSWHPDEAPRLNRPEMLRAADSALAALDAAHLQCVIVCHCDQPHPHVHCVVNRVDPADGRMAVLSKDRERLSQWAHAYERERGPPLTPKRAEKYGPEPERTRRERTPVAAAPTPHREPSQRAVLAQLDAAQRERHAQEWQALDATGRAERKAIQERHPAAKAIVAMHRKQRQAMEADLQATQAREMATLDAKSRGLIGRLRVALDAAREIREPGSGLFRLARLTIGFVRSPAAVRDHLATKQRSERDTLAKACKIQLAERMTATKTARQSELSRQTTSHDRKREALISRQGAEKAKIKEAWRVAPQPARARRAKSKAKDRPNHEHEAERQELEKHQHVRKPGRVR